ncbi:2-keto-4-pentenoate hydratase [Paracoccus fistulariae]|uniref:Fumarylacetoacetate hydrolase family protein n=1 Tax=Paracoccus fistulariae TaxID=658446 RepID=A0ABY7SMM1_9RHOB|nr:fumarylacetoacetate hydrolase family protein [Paracoccus fistulariae]MDB6180030.1 fumarylacetoacetate hydrolase family protein [Paracoccus fistulariae]WCR08119.1 fumarylacetoacetate hydrolase family protein [Paracoccus fistulariae]
MTSETNIRQAAERLWDAWKRDQPVPPVRDLIAADDAYAVQEINTQARLAEGGRLVGRKIGLTNPAVQKQLGVDQPDYGMLFADMDLPHLGELTWSEGAQWKAEAELAFIIGRDLPHADSSMAEVFRAVEYVAPAIEIVGSRVANWDISFADTVADNASSAFFTLGPFARRLAGIDLLDCRMEMGAGDEVVSQGSGRACLGSPLNALLWLARVMARAGRPLAEGDVVLSGALGPMVTARPGTTFTARIEGFGETAILFGD